MKKILLLFCVTTFFFLSAVSQPITLTFTAVDTNNEWALISRVVVTNVTRDWQETIYYPDTTFILENNVGIENEVSLVGSEIMLNVAPNPFDGVTDALLTLPEAGNVQLDICDINGRVVVSQSFPSLEIGMHSFRIILDVPQTYFIRATQNNRSTAAKLLNVGRGGDNRVDYQGFVKEKDIHVPKYVSTNPYAKGDLMRYVSYVTVCGALLQSLMVEENLTDSKLITFTVNAKQDTAIVNTGAVGNITNNSADGGGEVVYEGCGYVKQRGVCWDTVNNPTLANDYTSDGMGLGAFVSHISGLAPHATYFVRAYAINDAGVYYGNEVSFTTDNCEDSVITTAVSICSGDQYPWHGKVYSSAGTYYDSVPNSGGCYWIYQLNLNENQGYTVNENDSFCAGSAYSWHGKLLTTAGVYKDTLQSVHGCDSIITLYLTVSQNYNVNENDAFCSGNNYLWHGKILSTAGVYKDTLQSVSGCDSVVTLYLSENQNYTVNESDSFCIGSTYSWHGQSFAVAGTYYDYMHTIHGCDSTVILHLANKKSYYFIEKDTITSGASLVWHGKTLTTAGTYYDSLSASNGCDSIFELNLIVNPVNPTCSSVTDIDGNTYAVVQLGTQCWMAENLRTTRYANGLAIPMGSTATYNNVAYKYYPNGSAANVSTYGYLYNWRAVMGNSPSSSANPSGIQGICPNGWHVPSDVEWTTLTSYVSSQTAFQCGTTATYIAKSLSSQNYWYNYGNNGTCYVGDLSYPNNTTGFDARPAGYYSSGYGYDYSSNAYFWSSTQYSASNSYYRGLKYNAATVTSGNKAKYIGYSVRCVKGAGTLAACTDTIIEQTVSITYGMSYSWRGRILTDGGVYYDSLTRANGGCDSIYKLVLLADCGTVTDIDNNIYNTIQIGTQCWLRENLKTTRYANGVAIPMGSTDTYSNVAYKFYPNGSAANVSTYGYLYNWRAVMGNSPSSSLNPSGIQGICPNGWHVPSDAEWTTLTNYVTNHHNYIYSSTASYIAKALASNSYWYNYGNSGTYNVGDQSYPNNSTGFEARPAGYYSSGYGYDYTSNAYFWSSTQYSASNSYYRGLKYNAATVTSGNKAKYIGYSVRCVKGAGALAACTDTLIEQTVSITYGTSYSWRGKTLTNGGVYYDSLIRVNGGCDSIYKLILLADCGTVTDIDNNTYNTIQIGTQCWMRENLKTTRYANGLTIQMGSTDTYSNVAYKYYPNGSAANVSTYGYLYNWRAVMGNSASSSANPSGIQGICPTGWHVPSDAEWTTLTNYVTNHQNYTQSTTASYIAKALASNSYWYNYGNSGTYYVGDQSFPNNSTGFEARPAGYYSSGYGYDYTSNAYFWSSTQYSASNSYYRGLKYNAATVTSGNKAKYIGYSVRCVKGTGVLETCVDTIMEQTVSITYGTSYSWRGKTLTDGGVYYDSLQSNGGCDSIYKLILLADCGIVTDIDNNIYNTIQIGTQCWLRENLKTTRYANGVVIPMGSTDTYSNVAYKFYPNGSAANVSTYGYLYNWRAVMGNSPSSSLNPSGIQGICPNGWHVPSDAEWTTLTNYVTNHHNYTQSTTASYIAKALASNSYWYNYGNSGTYNVGDQSYPNNSTGFDARPAGYYSNGYGYDYTSNAYFWSSTQYSASNSYYRGLKYNAATVTSGNKAKYIGYSVRCVKGAGTLAACTDTIIEQTVSITYGMSYSWRGRILTDGGVYYDSLTRANGGCDSIYKLILLADCGTVTDIDNNTYNTIQIGTQCWMRENLKTTRYANGVVIPMGSTDTYSNVAYKYYPNGSAANVSTYGYLYNWRAVMGNSLSSSANPSGIQGICPNGWHVPSDAEWTTLTNYVTNHHNYIYSSTASYIAKALASNSYWYNYGNSGTYNVGDQSYPNNSTGFEARPAGYYSNGYGYDYTSNAYFWSSTQYSASNSYYRGLKYNAATVTSGNKAKYIGYSVRCVKGAGALAACTDTLIEQTVSITYGTSYSWRGKTLTNGGVYYDSLIRVNGGCDSIYKLILLADCGTVTDIDNNTYNTIQIGTQCWMRENLKTTRFADGTVIAMGSTVTYTTIPNMYYPNNSSANVSTYGYLYNWYAAMHNSSSSSANPSGVQGLCPNGWHIPSDAEWTTLTNYVTNHHNYTYSSTASYIAKALASNSYWYNYGNSGTYNVGDQSYPNNSTGFEARPAGYSTSGYGYDYTSNAYFWSATENSSSNSYYRSLSYSSAMVSSGNRAKYYGYSVRCVKD